MPSWLVKIVSMIYPGHTRDHTTSSDVRMVAAIQNPPYKKNYTHAHTINANITDNTINATNATELDWTSLY